MGSASSSGIAPLRDALRQILALDELHHERVHAAGLLEPIDRRDVGMIQRRERLRLALEPRQAVGVRRERVRQDLDRDLAAERRVRRPIHLPHAAFADRRGDFVDAEPGAWSEGQRCGLYGPDGHAGWIVPV